ncbi:MAG: PilZ domain-containing protein [Syntrophobacteraceae bacterium]
MDQSGIVNQRNAYRVRTPVLLACVPVTDSTEDDKYFKDHLLRALKQHVDVSLSMVGISFTCEWQYNLGDMIMIYVKPPDGNPIKAIGKVVRADKKDNGVTISARFLRLSHEDARNLTLFLLDRQRKACSIKGGCEERGYRYKE